MTDGTGTTTYGYDEFGRLSTVTDGAGAVVGYSYDTLGHVATVTYPDTHAITRQYDKAGRLKALTDWNNQTTSFGYDGDGNLRTTTYPNGVVDTIDVDAGDNATSVVVANGANTLASFGYTYTPSGLVDTTTDSIAPQTNRDYGYNKLHQLVGLDTQTTAYAYDNADNLTTLPDGSSMTYDPAGQLRTLTPTSGTATAFGFDGVGNRTTATGATNGTYTYDQEDQLTGSATAAGTATYTYNGDGLRAASMESGRSHAFSWDRLTSSLPVLLTDGVNDYVYGPNDEVVEQVDAASETTTYLHQDRAGSTRLRTDSSGAVVGSSSYDPYGSTISSTGTVSSPFGYDGEYTDTSGLIYLRARYYDPVTGQFLTLDRLVDATHEPYAYAGGDPINNVDPTGTVFSQIPDGNPYGYADSVGSGPTSATAAEFSMSSYDRFRSALEAAAGRAAAKQAAKDPCKGHSILKQFQCVSMLSLPFMTHGEGGAGDDPGITDELVYGYTPAFQEAALTDSAFAEGVPENYAGGDAAGLHFASSKQLSGHFTKHENEFSGEYENPEAYLQGARDFFSGARGAGYASYIRPNGDTVVYNYNSNEIGMVTKSGVIKTFFRPKNGSEYFADELYKDVALPKILIN
jgi:RHS repeat-associated protein